MRLRYLHLPRCGPLTDTTVVFGREDLVARVLKLPRKGSLNFVVGVNGSGKSSLFRALYQIFRSLKNREFPPMPVTLAWDIAPAGETVTAILHIPDGKGEKPFFYATKQARTDTDKQSWAESTRQLKNEQNDFGLEQTLERGDAVLGSYLQAHLPKRFIVYTSGADDAWLRLDYPPFHPKEEEEGQYQTEDERSQGWTMDREWESELPSRIANVLARYPDHSGASSVAANTGKTAEPFHETISRLREELAPLETIREKIATNRQPRADRLDDTYFRIRTPHLRLAGITMALWQTAREMAGRNAESQREALRKVFLQQRGANDRATDARRLLNEIDWFWPTHLSLTYHDTDDSADLQQRQELFCLVALADEVVAQPRGRQRAVFSLGPSDRINLTEKLQEAFPLGIPNKAVEFMAERVDGCRTGAEAILRVLSSDGDLDSTPLDVFSRLRDWQRTGLLEEITLTVKRLHRPVAEDDVDGGEESDARDDVIVTYDQLSDGEQMLLGRMGLIFLLRGQNGSLLLLDEPETHFNDVWKREIVEMLNIALLNTTDANVVVATHTSIALTDAFAAEVTVLDKTAGGMAARGVNGGLFGTDPGEVAMKLFHAESSIGSRSLELLEGLRTADWRGRENDLAAVLDVLGSSFHRAELRAILQELRANPDGATST